MQKRVFLGFGFGAIQGGLFLYEAQRARSFDRLVVVEVVPEVVQAIRRHGRYDLNVATRTRVEQHPIEGVEVFNPNVSVDREALVEVVAEASEIATALPSVDFYDRGEASVAGILAEGFTEKLEQADPRPCVVYTAENNNHAAEILAESVNARLDDLDVARLSAHVQYLNTVIGKMSRVVTDPHEIVQEKLVPVAPQLKRALLVEEFNRILISQIKLPGFQRGLTVFEEKSDLFPFEDAKLYGHNAVHAFIGYLAQQKGCRFIFEAGQDQGLMQLAREAFLEESGPAVIQKHRGVDPLFTTAGYRAYAEDLLVRMVSPYLRDSVERVTRDPRRKLAWDDRLVGTMRLALAAGVTPKRFAIAARAALESIVAEEPDKTRDALLDELWLDAAVGEGERKRELKKLILADAAGS